MSKCFYCDKPATRYCDFKIGCPIGGYVRVGPVSQNQFRACIDINATAHTCDMPMCEDHKKQIGHWHVSGKASFTETIDCCPEHVGHNDHSAKPCTEDEAAVIRRDIIAKARRRLIAEKNRATYSTPA